MLRSLIYSITFHSLLILLTILSLPFMLREPVDLPPIVSVELIQISDKTRIPYAPKARKLIEEKKSNKVTQSSQKNSFASGLTLSEEDALRAQIFGCWSIPLGLPYNEDLLVRIKLNLKPDGSIINSEILDHARMNKPGQGFYKVLAESALRAVRLCQPLRAVSYTHLTLPTNHDV